jgi:hypothetical protein
MAHKSDPISVRLPAELGRRFLALRQRIDLPAAMVLRLLLAPQLERSLEEQVSIVLSQVQRRKSPTQGEIE